MDKVKKLQVLESLQNLSFLLKASKGNLKRNWVVLFTFKIFFYNFQKKKIGDFSHLAMQLILFKIIWVNIYILNKYEIST